MRFRDPRPIEVVGCLVLLGFAAPLSGQSETSDSSAGSVVCNVDARGRLSVSARASTTEEILASVSRCAGVRAWTFGPLETTRASFTVNGATLRDLIARTLGTTAYVIRDRGVRELWVYPKRMRIEPTRIGARPDDILAADLAGRLGSGDSQIRFEAVADLLERSDDPMAFELLAQVAATDAEARVRALAVTGVGQSGEPEALEVLAPLLGDPSVAVREAAIVAVGDLKGEGAVSLLRLAIRDQDATLRELAVYALADISALGSREALTVALSDPEGEVREAAREVLAEIERQEQP